MTSSPVSPDDEGTRPISAPLAAGGGVRIVVAPATDWFTALDDLMAVVEAFCPTWPEREACGPMHDLRL